MNVLINFNELKCKHNLTDMNACNHQEVVTLGENKK